MLHPTTRETLQITITAEQIYGAAQKIVDHNEDAWQYTEAQVLAAVEHYIRCKIKSLLVDINEYAAEDSFSLEPTCAHPVCRNRPTPHHIYCEYHHDYYPPAEADELILPEPPPWFNADIDRATAPMASRPELIPDENGEYLWIP